MITEDERIIKIQEILTFSDIHPNDCIKINDLIIDLSKQKECLQNIIDKAIKCTNELRNYCLETDKLMYSTLALYTKNLEEILRSKE